MGAVFTLALLVFLIFGIVLRYLEREKAAKKINQQILERRIGNLARAEESFLFSKEAACSVELVNDEGIPEFKYRFRANLSFDSPSSALLKHGKEEFIPRPNGNRDAIEEPGGYWMVVSPWDNAEIRERIEEELFKYVGGSAAYIALLVAVRKAYEDQSLSPREKKDVIKAICDENHNVYTVRHVHIPPWESLLVPVFSLAEGLGPHRVSLLYASNIRTIVAARGRTDAEILAIKGIGKAALSAVRNLSSLWPYDESTEVIERDAEYRRVISFDQSVH